MSGSVLTAHFPIGQTWKEGDSSATRRLGQAPERSLVSTSRLPAYEVACWILDVVIRLRRKISGEPSLHLFVELGRDRIGSELVSEQQGVRLVHSALFPYVNVSYS